jgi:hypothetical protein
MIAPDAYDSTDTIRYRALSRDDFRASSMLPHLSAHAAGLGAYTCAFVIPDRDAQIRVERRGERGDYVASARALSYRAEIDRSCSWWNADQRQLSEAYVLEHEQIHFALAEIHARRLTGRTRRLESAGESPSAAAEALQTRIEQEMAAALEELREESTRFDEETSGVHDPARQARWLADVERRLSARP